MSKKVIDLSTIRQEREWQRIMPLLELLETTLNSTPPTAEQLAEEEIIDTQLKAIDCKTKAKLLLLRALENPEAGPLSHTDTRVKNALENDPAVIYQKDTEFWSEHISQFRCFDNKQRKAFYKRNKALTNKLNDKDS